MLRLVDPSLSRNGASSKPGAVQFNPEDRKTRSDFAQRVLNTLTVQKGKGTVEKIGNGLRARWRLPAEPADHAA
ncbi:hypothetical protein [Azospirillum sp. B510]|uniref:hypothetical protein n=1 Tax=Azospirillum sp. (strain B510) TaxID=137722 RepID=UPI0002F0BD78|nr:hypothetical protein [Azospirillum sp. B510]